MIRPDRWVMRLDRIVVGDRIRVGAGDIGGLAASIEEIGLLNPPVVTEALELVAGFRRYSAMLFLGWTHTEVRVMSGVDPLLAEIHENEHRSDFTISESYAAGMLLEQRLVQQGVVGRVRDIVARHLRIGSGRTWDRLKTVMQSGDHELIQRLTEGSIEIGAASRILRARGRAGPVLTREPGSLVSLRDTTRGVEVTAMAPHPSVPAGVESMKLFFTDRDLANRWLLEHARAT